MEYVRQQDEMQGKVRPHEPAGADDLTVNWYKQRSRILLEAQRSEWWVTLAVVLLIVGMGFVAI